MKVALFAVVGAFVLAGCSGGGTTSQASQGSLELSIVDDAAGARLVLDGAFLRSDAGWIQALPNGTAYDLKGGGGNASVAAKVPAGSYDRLRLIFANVTMANRTALLVQDGIELAFSINVTDGGKSVVTIGFAWVDSLFESAAGLAFEPVVDRLKATEDGSVRLNLNAQGISSGGTKAPVARMRVFDETGLEVFASSFVADSPANPFIGNPGVLTLTASPSEVIEPGAKLASFRWDVGETVLEGANAQFDTGQFGGNLTIRLSVKDSAGGQDTQTVRIAVRPGFVQQYANFTGTVTGAESARVSSQGQSTGTVIDAAVPPKSHPFAVNESLEGLNVRLANVQVELTPTTASATHDLNLRLFNKTAQVATATGAGSTHTISFDVKPGLHPPGNWSAQVLALYGAQVSYRLVVTLNWQFNPEMLDFLAAYDDGHSHEH